MPQPSIVQGWGANDTPVSTSGGGWGANDTPVAGATKPTDKELFDQLTAAKKSGNFLGAPIAMGPPGAVAGILPRLTAAGKAAIAPKAGGRLSRILDAFKPEAPPPTAPNVPDSLVSSAEGFDPAAARQTTKQLNRFTPGSQPSGRATVLPRLLQ